VKTFFDPSYWKSVSRNPAALVGLVADLAPIFAVIFWGWGAAALVLLYWLENVIIGAIVVPRMIIASVGRFGAPGLLGCLFGVPFFVFHYGMFCAVHGMFLMIFFQPADPVQVSPDMLTMLQRLVFGSLTYARHMDWILVIVIAAHLFAFVTDFILKGGWKETTFEQEMGAPYGRIVVMHLGIFVIAGALFALGDPAFGAIFLVLARAVWGLHTNMEPRKTAEPAPVPAVA
jgi:hypothetical protein